MAVSSDDMKKYAEGSGLALLSTMSLSVAHEMVGILDRIKAQGVTLDYHTMDMLAGMYSVMSAHEDWLTDLLTQVTAMTAHELANTTDEHLQACKAFGSPKDLAHDGQAMVVRIMSLIRAYHHNRMVSLEEAGLRVDEETGHPEGDERTMEEVFAEHGFSLEDWTERAIDRSRQKAESMLETLFAMSQAARDPNELN